MSSFLGITSTHDSKTASIFLETAMSKFCVSCLSSLKRQKYTKPVLSSGLQMRPFGKLSREESPCTPEILTDIMTLLEVPISLEFDEWLLNVAISRRSAEREVWNLDIPHSYDFSPSGIDSHFYSNRVRAAHLCQWSMQLLFIYIFIYSLMEGVPAFALGFRHSKNL